MVQLDPDYYKELTDIIENFKPLVLEKYPESMRVVVDSAARNAGRTADSILRKYELLRCYQLLQERRDGYRALVKKRDVDLLKNSGRLTSHVKAELFGMLMDWMGRYQLQRMVAFDELVDRENWWDYAKNHDWIGLRG